MVQPTGLSAARAYAASQTLAGAAKAPPAAPGGSESFAELLGRAVGTVADSGRQADALKSAAALGQKPDYVAMVTAVAESEAAFETLVAVRDKVIAAYEEIMRMPI